MVTAAAARGTGFGEGTREGDGDCSAGEEAFGKGNGVGVVFTAPGETAPLDLRVKSNMLLRLFSPTGVVGRDEGAEDGGVPSVVCRLPEPGLC